MTNELNCSRCAHISPNEFVAVPLSCKILTQTVGMDWQELLAEERGMPK